MCLHPGPITKSKSCPNKWCLYKIATQPQDAGQHHFTTKSGTTMDMLLNPQIRLYKKKVCTGGYRLRFCRGNWWGDYIYIYMYFIFDLCMILISSNNRYFGCEACQHFGCQSFENRGSCARSDDNESGFLKPIGFMYDILPGGQKSMLVRCLLRS